MGFRIGIGGGFGPVRFGYYVGGGRRRSRSRRRVRTARTSARQPGFTLNGKHYNGKGTSYRSLWLVFTGIIATLISFAVIPLVPVALVLLVAGIISAVHDQRHKAEHLAAYRREVQQARLQRLADPGRRIQSPLYRENRESRWP